MVVWAGIPIPSRSLYGSWCQRFTRTVRWLRVAGPTTKCALALLVGDVSVIEGIPVQRILHGYENGRIIYKWGRIIYNQFPAIPRIIHKMGDSMIFHGIFMDFWWIFQQCLITRGCPRTHKTQLGMSLISIPSVNIGSQVFFLGLLQPQKESNR